MFMLLSLKDVKIKDVAQQHMPCNTSHGGITRLVFIYYINSWLCLTGRR